VAEPQTAEVAGCPQCGGDAEPEQDGRLLYYACTVCGSEFGYRYPAAPAAGVCQLGLDIAVDEGQSPGVVSLRSGLEQRSVFIGTIGRRPE
jgi:hypothetical protein